MKEIESYEQKCAHYSKRANYLQSRINIIGELCRLLVDKEANTNELSCLRDDLEVNSLSLDLLELEGKLENAKMYQKHYSERAEAIKIKEAQEIKECEGGFSALANEMRNYQGRVYNSLNKHSSELYHRIMSDLSKPELAQDKKLVLFSLMKQFLQK